MSVTHSELRAGVTLVELVLVIAVIAISLAVVGIGVAPSHTDSSVEDHHEIASLRRAALASGRDTTAILLSNGSARLVTVLRDGRVLLRDGGSPLTSGTDESDAPR